MALTEMEALTLTANMGEAARAFMESQLGQKLLEMADAQVREAVFKFSEVDAADDEKVRELQMRVRMGLAFGDWLQELVQAGDEAISIYKQAQENG